jgi:hypothetical protein
MHWITHNRRYGYTVDGNFYVSKVQALKATGGDIDRLHLYFNNDAWANLDYTQEPSQSWTELMDQRVREIRDQYKYVALFFSGGYDSSTILNAFVRNHLPIDELIIWEREWLPETRVETHYAFNIARQLKDWLWRDLKVTYQLKTIRGIRNFYLENAARWIEHPGAHLGMQKNIRDWEFESKDNITHGLHEKPGTIIIEGREKPRLDFRDGKWYAMMNDKLLSWCMGNAAEQFYFSPQAPNIYLKNCYMLIDWIESNFDVTHELVHQLQDVTKMSPDLYQEFNLALGRDPVYMDSHRYGLNKYFNSGGHIKQPDSVRLRDSIDDTDHARRIWQSGLDEITSAFLSAMQEDGADLKTVVGHRYYLREHQSWKRKNKTDSLPSSL